MKVEELKHARNVTILDPETNKTITVSTSKIKPWIFGYEVYVNNKLWRTSSGYDTFKELSIFEDWNKHWLDEPRFLDMDVDKIILKKDENPLPAFSWMYEEYKNLDFNSMMYLRFYLSIDDVDRAFQNKEE